MRAVLVLSLLLASCSKSTEPPDPPDPPEFGAPCGDGLECAGGLSCVTDSRFPGGYCSSLCAAAPCPEGGRCVEEIGTPLCLAECASDAECRAGYACWRGTCRPPCMLHVECGEGGRCEGGRCTGAECMTDGDCGPGMSCVDTMCVGGPDAGMMDAGTPDCLRGSDCPSGICLPLEYGGRCTTACGDREECAPDEACSPVPIDSDLDGTADTAVAACVTLIPDGGFLAARCGSGSVCESRSCIAGQCAEACNDDSDCLPGQECRARVIPDSGDTMLPVCWYPGRGGAVGVYDIDLGTQDVVAGGATPRINFAVPADAISITLIAQRTAGDSTLGLTFVDVWDPASRHLFDLGEISMLVDQPIRWLPLETEEVASMLIPNTTPDRVRFIDGRYGVTVAGLAEMSGDSRRATIRLTARVKRARGADVTTGTLDLNVFLVGVGLTAAQARTNTRLQNALTEADRILGASGIGIGTVTYTEITGADATRYSVIDSSDGPDSEMSQLFELSAGHTEDAINIFLVRSIAAGAGESGGIALGIAGGIPGPPSIHGTPHSGVLVSFDTAVVGSDYRTVAQIMSHEMGHYLGLFHVREQARPCRAGEMPTMADPCAPFGGEDVLADTSRSDGRNLMYFALGGSDGRTYNIALSDGQGFVMLRYPVVR